MRPPGFEQLVTFLYTRDLDAAERFYGDTLGLTRVLDQGTCRIFRVSERAFVGICHDPERAAANPGVIITLVTDLVDEWYEHLVDAGVLFERAPRYNEQFDVYHAFFRDPDGHLIEIQQFQSPAWPRV